MHARCSLLAIRRAVGGDAPTIPGARVTLLGVVKAVVRALRDIRTDFRRGILLVIVPTRCRAHGHTQ